MISQDINFFQTFIFFNSAFFIYLFVCYTFTISLQYKVIGNAFIVSYLFLETHSRKPHGEYMLLEQVKLS